MQPSNPGLILGSPVRRPAQFEPSDTWTDGNYVYRYDAGRDICKRTPINPRIRVGTMFFATATVSDCQPIAAALRRPWRWPRRVLSLTLWTTMIGAAVMLVLPWWPAVMYRLDPPKVNLPVVPTAAALPAPHPMPGVSAATATAPSIQPITDNRVYIPSIGVDTPIVEGPSLNILNKVEGIWHQTGASANNLVLAGHRYKYLPPNTSTLYNLNLVKVGDMIGLDWLSKRTIYKVALTEVVPANDVSIINPSATPELTIYSCNDVFMTHRVVVIARPLPLAKS